MLSLGLGQIRTLVSMATDSSNRPTMGKSIKKIFFYDTTWPKVFIFCV